jgi:transcription elongation factor Elf1
MGLRKERDQRYKLKVRHGGFKLIGNCSSCGKSGSTYDIVMHHTKDGHEGQILLCRSCHLKIHGAPDKRKDISLDQVKQIVSQSDSCIEAAKKLGLSKTGFYNLRSRLALPELFTALQERSKEKICPFERSLEYRRENK